MNTDEEAKRRSPRRREGGSLPAIAICLPDLPCHGKLPRGRSPDARYAGRRLAGAGIDSRGVREADYRVLVQTSCPAVLVEMGFLSNGSEAAALGEASHQDRIAEAVSQAVLNLLADRRR